MWCFNSPVVAGWRSCVLAVGGIAIVRCGIMAYWEFRQVRTELDDLKAHVLSIPYFVLKTAAVHADAIAQDEARKLREIVASNNDETHEDLYMLMNRFEMLSHQITDADGPVVRLRQLALRLEGELEQLRGWSTQFREEAIQQMDQMRDQLARVNANYNAMKHIADECFRAVALDRISILHGLDQTMTTRLFFGAWGRVVAGRRWIGFQARVDSLRSSLVSWSQGLEETQTTQAAIEARLADVEQDVARTAQR